MTKTIAATDIVTSLTFIDLLLLDYDEFQDELTCAHAKLQYLSTDNQGNRYLFFPGLLWWYTITQKPEDQDSPNGVWCLLNGPGAYKNMVDTMANVQDMADVTLELTNNLEYTTSHATLPISRYPTTIIEDRHGNYRVGETAKSYAEIEAREVPIYPAYFRLSRTPQVTLPSSVYPSHGGRLLDYSPFNLQQLLDFDHDFPPGLCLAPTVSPICPTPSLARNSTSHSLYPPNLSQQPITPVTTLPQDLGPDSPSNYFESSTMSPSQLPLQAHEQPSPAEYLSDRSRSWSMSRDTTSHHSYANPPNSPAPDNSILIYTRAKPLLGRRYSIPFDQKTTAHGAPLSLLQARRVSATDPSSYNPANLGFNTTNSEKMTFGNADWVLPDFGIFAGLSEGTVV